MPGELLGEEFELYLDTASSGAGNYDTPTWGSPQCSVGDISYDPDYKAVQVNKRCDNVQYKKGREDNKLTFQMNFSPTDAFHVAIRNASRTGAKLHMALAEGPIASADYVHGWWLVKAKLTAALDESATYDVECMPHTDAPDDEPIAYVEGS